MPFQMERVFGVYKHPPKTYTPTLPTVPLPCTLLAWNECPPVQGSEGAIIPQQFCMQAQTLATTHPVGHKEPLCFSDRWTYTLSHAHIDYVFDSECKRLN